METTDFVFRPIVAQDVVVLSTTMREDDVAELEALELTPTEALLTSWGRSTMSASMVLGGELAAMLGVWPVAAAATALGEEVWGIWLLSGEPVNRHKESFMQASVAILRALVQRYGTLVQMVDARYTKSVRWGQRLGFEVFPAVPYGPRGMPFHPVRIRR